MEILTKYQNFAMSFSRWKQWYRLTFWTQLRWRRAHCSFIISDLLWNEKLSSQTSLESKLNSLVGTVVVPIAATDNELITRDGGVGARNAGAAGIETRSTVGRKPADKNFKKRPVSFVTGYTYWEGVVAAIIAAADNNRTRDTRRGRETGERLERLKFVTSQLVPERAAMRGSDRSGASVPPVDRSALLAAW